MVSRIAPKNPKAGKLFLREWREFVGFSQEALAERMETTKSTISRMESATREPNLGYIISAAEQLRCRPEDLFHPPLREQPASMGFAEPGQAAFSSAAPAPDNDDLRAEVTQAIKLLEKLRSRL
jgi:transcriptional regulator with XRE-family HTH domain